MPAAPRAVTGNIAMLTGEAREGIAIKFTRTGAGDVFGQYDDVVVNEPVWATSGAGGAITVTLYPGTYEVVASGSHGPKSATITLNEDGSADFAALIGQASGPITNAVQLAAEQARDKAEAWADNPEDVAVESGQFSAKHHAIKAAASAAAADDDAQATAADRLQTGLDRVATGQDRTQTGLDRTQTGLDRVATGADRVQTGLDVIAADADRVAAAGHQSAAEVAAGLAQTAALSMIGPETLYPVPDFPIPDGWWDTNVRYGTLGSYDERAVISNWHPALVAGGRDLFWFSALEADLDVGIRGQVNGGVNAAVLGGQVGSLFPTYPNAFTLGADKTAPASLSGYTGNTSVATVDGKRVATSIGDGTFGLTHTIGSGIQNKLHRVLVRWSGNTAGVLYADLGNISMQFSSAASGEAEFYVTPTSLTAIIVYAVGGTGAGRTFAVEVIQVAEVVNFADHALLGQNSGTLRFLFGRQPVSGVRNRLLNSAWEGAVSGSPGTPPTSWTQVQTGGTVTVNGSVVTFAVSAARNYWTREVTLLSNSAHFFSVIADVAVAARLDNLFNVFGLPGGATAQFVLDGVDVPSNTIPGTGVRQIGIRVVTTTNGGAVSLNIGGGVTTGASTSTVTFSDPQFETGSARTAYQRSGVQGTLDVTEAGVRSIPVLRGDLNDDRMAVVIPSKNMIIYPRRIGAGLIYFSTFPGTVTIADNAGLAEDGVTPVGVLTIPANVNGGMYVPAATLGTKLRGRQFTVTFKAKRTAGTGSLEVRDNGSTVYGTYNPTGSWAKYIITGTAPDTTNGEVLYLVLTGDTAHNQQVIQYDEIQVELGSAATDFEGDVVGTGIVAGRAGIWTETVRNPRLVSREVQTALTTGLLLPGSSVLGLPAVVHGASTDPSRGLVDFLLYDRVLTEAEIKKVARRVRGAGAGRRWVYSSRILNEDFSSYANTAAMLAAGWTTARDATVELSAGRIRVAQNGTTFPGAVRSLVGGLIEGHLAVVRARLTSPVASYSARSFIGDSASSTAYSLIATVSPGLTQDIAYAFLVTQQAAASGFLSVGTNGVVGTEMFADNITIDLYRQE